MRQQQLTRRDALLQCVSIGALRIASPLALGGAVNELLARESHAAQKETQWNEIGPFYKRLAPNQSHLRMPGDPGLPLSVTGAIFDSAGQVVPDAKVEIWHADHHGLYDIDGYRFRATLITGKEGEYSFDSVMPGHYPDRVCQHIHFLVTSPGHKPMVTQLYFATDPVFEGNPDRNYHQDPLIISRELIRPVTLSGDPNAFQANVRFEVIVERL